MKKWGKKSTLQVKEIRDKQKETYNKHKKENKNFVKNIVNKRKETYKNKTGYENPNQNPIIQKQIKKTNKKKYGFETPLLNEKIKNKIKTTKKERYNDENYTNREQASKSLQKHFSNADLKKETLNKTIKTNKEKYNCSWGLQNDNIKQKAIETWKQTLGVTHPSKSNKIRRKQQSKYTYENKNFDSSWELAFYIYLKDKNVRFEFQTVSIDYYWKGDNKMHTYHVDFKVFNTLIEIKSPYLYNKMLIKNTKENAKLNCMLNNKVKIITNCKKYINYVKTKYGSNYLKSFRNRKT